jgi:nitronate monooxygenase
MVLEATGDETIRTSVYDVVWGRVWPPGYTGRLMRNDFIERWQGHETELAQVHGEELRKVEEAQKSDDFEIANVTVGESIGLVHDIPKAGNLIHRIVADASNRLMKFAPALAA